MPQPNKTAVDTSTINLRRVIENKLKRTIIAAIKIDTKTTEMKGVMKI
jgi:hypothetical protein